LGTRARSQPAPPRFVFEALIDPSRYPERAWLCLLDDEIPPEVLASTEYELVTWSSLWVKRPEAQIRFDIAADGQGSRLRWTLLNPEDPGPATVGHMRKRLNQLINAELRFSFGQ
jgi:hypothetical protein